MVLGVFLDVHDGEDDEDDFLDNLGLSIKDIELKDEIEL